VHEVIATIIKESIDTSREEEYLPLTVVPDHLYDVPAPATSLILRTDSSASIKMGH
jgi:hypothetical protein